MRNLIRPELRAALWPWREAMAGAALVALGVFWALTGLGLLAMAGVVLCLIGSAVLMLGIRRARFPRAGGGPGVVEVDERQITYFGPENGAALSIDALERVEFDTTRGRAWVLHGDGAPPLRIPADASGAESLFDALAPLPGLNHDLLVSAARSDAHRLFVIWQKHRIRLPRSSRLH